MMMMREKLIEVMNNSSFVHIIVNSKYHYNGWIQSIDSEYIKMRDRKTDEEIILKISDISLIEEVKE